MINPNRPKQARSAPPPGSSGHRRTDPMRSVAGAGAAFTSIDCHRCPCGTGACLRPPVRQESRPAYDPHPAGMIARTVLECIMEEERRSYPPSPHGTSIRRMSLGSMRSPQPPHLDGRPSGNGIAAASAHTECPPRPGDPADTAAAYRKRPGPLPRSAPTRSQCLRVQGSRHPALEFPRETRVRSVLHRPG